MSTYLEAQDELLDWINRPASEMRVRAKSIINQTILWMQRKHQFHFAERLIRVTYPANSFKLDITTACDGRPRDYKNIQLLSQASSNEGLNLYMKSYSSIMMEKFKYQRTSNPVDFDMRDFGSQSMPPVDEAAFSTFITRNHQHFAFFNGSDLGLYPTPQADKLLLINLHVFLDTLSADDDTNFLLENCYDFIILKSLKRMNIFLKTEGRIPIPAEEVQDAWDSILQWDKEVMIGDQQTQ